jgi:hypothetical protein
MPVHDWTRVDAGTFHAFHTLWISELMKALNTGVLPKGYYALAEQVATCMRAARLRRHLVVRHISGHQIVALIEIVSPANKDRQGNVRELAEKVLRSLEAGVHVLVTDLLPPGRHDPHGLHGAVWGYFDTTPCSLPAEGSLTLASYAWHGTEPEAYIEPVAVGQALIDMPLFLTADRYVNVPLEATYLAAYGGMPELSRTILEEDRRPPS